ncbi:hypothetical protein FNL56_27075 [Tardiphaga sp. vice304]|uniref:hypothetical protein n=1 Tax=Tardiphaga sp. vice304 TaxID=2592817 RepID=UPI001165B964|nr:hypothetical protein [Tardiphaga sp. vice304]QDM29361.1 hypothetical protein FNL56_27075 [Tardiphaga sp. vice304]
MGLTAAFGILDAELNVLASELRSFSSGRAQLAAANQFSLLDECLLEGLLSRVWQSWCSFARVCVVDSCMGTTSASGAAVSPLIEAVSDPHVSWAAIRAKNKPNPPYWGATNTVLRVEPTWGDVDVLNKILTKLRPSNHLQLLAAFSSITPSAKALQTIRNGAAHHNAETMAEVRSLQSSYVAFRIDHPTHALFWTEPTSSDFLVTFAIDEIRVAAQAAIS